METPLLLTTTQAAQRLGIGRTKLYELIGAGELPTIPIGRAKRVPAAAVQDWIDRKLTQASIDHSGA